MTGETGEVKATYAGTSLLITRADDPRLITEQNRT